jgi:hypothetical protein
MVPAPLGIGRGREGTRGVGSEAGIVPVLT